MRATAADSGAVIAASGDSAQQCVGELVEFSGLPAHQEAGWILAVDMFVAGAVFAGHFFVFKDGDSRGTDEAGDSFFNLGMGKNFDGACVICDGVECATAGDDGDADAIDLRVEQIFAMAFRVHPERVNALGCGGDSDVFFNEAEMRAGVRGALGEVGFVKVLVRDGALGSHAQTMLAGGSGEGWIPSERAETGFSAGAIGGVEEDLSFGLNALGIGERRENEREKQRDESDNGGQERWRQQQRAGEARSQFPLIWIEIQRAVLSDYRVLQALTRKSGGCRGILKMNEYERGQFGREGGGWAGIWPRRDDAGASSAAGGGGIFAAGELCGGGVDGSVACAKKSGGD